MPYAPEPIAILVAPRTWTAVLPEWWAAVHATCSLGAIDDPGARRRPTLLG